MARHPGGPDKSTGSKLTRTEIKHAIAIADVGAALPAFAGAVGFGAITLFSHTAPPAGVGKYALAITSGLAAAGLIGGFSSGIVAGMLD